MATLRKELRPAIKALLVVFHEYMEDTLKTEEEIELQIKQFTAIGDIIKSLVSWVFVVKIVCAASKILINGSMLYGVIQKKAGFMLPWLIFGMLSIVLCIALLVLGFFVLSVGTPAGILNGVILLILTSPFVGLMLYFWLVVRSAYMDLREAGPVLPVFVDEDPKIEKAGGKYIKM
jgi:hypothetical protein